MIPDYVNPDTLVTTRKAMRRRSIAVGLVFFVLGFLIGVYTFGGAP